jgi:hypothetical protein
MHPLEDLIKGSRVIPLTQGQVTIVDEEDYDWLNQWKWFAVYSPRGRYFYTRRNNKNEQGKPEWEHMHRLITGAKPGQITDLINRNTLDNRRSNLRLVTHIESVRNRKMQRHNTSGYRGVTFNKKSSKWQAQISVENDCLYLGVYQHPQDAAKAYDKAALKYYGHDFAQLNFPSFIR